MAIRLATPNDAAALLAIYAQYIDTSTTFEIALPTQEAFAQRIADTAARYPYLVCEEAGQAVGYAYARPQRERAAYQWGAELSVYLDRACVGRGLGRQLYSLLMELLRLQGIRTVYGCITSPNPRSEGLHAALGFHRIGVFHAAGFKAGAWRDVVWYEKAIAPCDAPPSPLLPFPAVDPEKVASVLDKAF